MPRKAPHDAALLHSYNVVSHTHFQLLEGLERFTDEDGRESYKLSATDGDEVCSILSILTDYLEWNTEDLR